VHVLIWGGPTHRDLLNERSVNYQSGHWSIKPWRTRCHRRLRANEVDIDSADGATPPVIEQKSADEIVANDINISIGYLI
jgi:hypothetical protein